MEDTLELNLPVQEEAPKRSKARANDRPLLKELGLLGIKIAIIAALFAFVFTFIYGFNSVRDADMAPMVKDGDITMFFRLDKDYVIGDLAVVDFQGEHQVRRVIAKAGDVVDITDDGLKVNGALLQELDIYQKTRRYEGGVSFPLTVGEGQVFVLGDARENATDSRIYGPVNTKDTLGTVITVIRQRHF